MEVSEEKRITDNEITDSIKTKVSSFPNMPRAAVKLRTLLKKDDVQVDEIANILRQDPGLTTNVLRLANSAHFGLSQKVGSLKQAVMLLGVKRFEQIAISACMNKTMDKAVEGYDLSPGELWLHSITVATTAEALAKIVKRTDASDVFTAALLHDMGKLILGNFIENKEKQIESIVSKKIPLHIAENMVFGTDHAEIGSLIMAKWSFPPEIVNAVRWHHDPDHISRAQNRLKEPTMQSDIVYLSNLMFQSNGDIESVDEKFVMPSLNVLKRLGIKIDQYKVIAEKAHSWKNELSETLTLE